MKIYQSPIVKILQFSQADIRTDILRASNETEPDPLFSTVSEPILME